MESQKRSCLSNLISNFQSQLDSRALNSKSTLKVQFTQKNCQRIEENNFSTSSTSHTTSSKCQCTSPSNGSAPPASHPPQPPTSAHNAGTQPSSAAPNGPTHSPSSSPSPTEAPSCTAPPPHKPSTAPPATHATRPSGTRPANACSTSKRTKPVVYELSEVDSDEAGMRPIRFLRRRCLVEEGRKKRSLRRRR